MRINTALILCAGFGKRLSPLTIKTPKPLLKINNLTLLENTINLIQKLDVKKIKLNTFYLKDKIKSFIEKLETLIISIPPGRKSNEDDYVTKIQNLLSNVDSTDIKRIIFLSSISVYGPSGGEYDELSPINPVTSAAKAVCNCEGLINISPIPSIIIRLGGLIGEDRNPIFQLQNRKIRNPKGRINFIHQYDAVNGIAKLVLNNELKGVFNLVSPHHPI